MRRFATIILGPILCGVLATSPAFVIAATGDGSRRANLLAEIEEQLSDPKVEERNHDKAYRYKSAPCLSSAVDEPEAHGAALCSRLPIGRVARRDDPPGSLAHGLRAPPAQTLDLRSRSKI